MKRIFAISLAFCIFSQASVRTAWMLHYQWNRAVYLKNCENRDKPDMKCDGKCYLKKQMAVSENADPKEPRLPEGFHRIRDIQLYCEFSGYLSPFTENASEAKSLPFYTRRFPPDAPLAGVFKPPQPGLVD